MMGKGQLQLLVLVVCCSLIEGLVGAVKQSHFIHWNTSNPIFRIDNTDHIIDVNRGNKPWEYDQVNIICPVYRPGQASDRDKERSVIYSVSKDEYETCRITQPNPRVIAICNKPHELMYFTITFRSFTPTPGGMEFTPGKDYYFITTSSSDDLFQRVGGRCSTHHMKVAFKVADNVQHQTTHKPSAVVNVPRHPQRPPFYPPGAMEDAAEAATKDHKDFMYRHTPEGSVSSTKKRTDDLKSHPNDVIKHEASRLASITAASEAPTFGQSKVLLLLCAIMTAAVLKLY